MPVALQCLVHSSNVISFPGALLPSYSDAVLSMRKGESKSIGKYILFFTVLRFDPFRFFRSFRRRDVDEFRMEEAFVQREKE